jgi:hypothetical protein
LKNARSKWPDGIIPESLVDFWSNACGSIQFHYFWESPKSIDDIFPGVHNLHGGAKFPPALEIYPGNSLLDENNPEMKEAIGERAFEWWKKSAIFHTCMSGNCLALGTSECERNPPVLFLSQKDKSSGIISNSFDSFLETWAELCFVTPDTFFEYWKNESTGLLDLKLYKTKELQAMLSTLDS